MPEIKPYGEEWVKEMMRFKKLDIIKILRGAIFGKMQEVDAAMKAAKMLKEQRDEAYAEVRRVVSIKEKQREALTQISKFDAYHQEWPADSYVNAPPADIARAALEEEA